MIVCIGLRFVMPVISPVCYNGIPRMPFEHFFVKKGTNTSEALALQIPLLQLYGDMSRAVLNDSLCV